MLKTLSFIFVLFFLFSFYAPVTSAKTVPACTTETIDTSDPNPLLRDRAGQCPDDTATTIYVCYKPTTASTGRATNQCLKLSTTGTPGAPGAPGAAAAPAATPCTGPTCTSGSGQRCDPANQGAISPTGKGIYTAIGCVPTEPQQFIEGLLKYGTFAAGGIAFIIMLLASLQMITAEGNPENIKHAQEKFYSAIIGLLLIVFSVLLMQVIGVDILGLPGFER